MSTSAEFALANEIYALNYRRFCGDAVVDIRAPSYLFFLLLSIESLIKRLTNNI